MVLRRYDVFDVERHRSRGGNEDEASFSLTVQGGGGDGSVVTLPENKFWTSGAL